MGEMSNRDKAESKSTEFNWPTEAELINLVGKIDIPDKWKELNEHSGGKKFSAITPEYLQDLARQIVDNEPMERKKWEDNLDILIYRLSASKQPVAQELWDLFLTKGVQAAAKSVEDARPEDVEWKTLSRND